MTEQQWTIEDANRELRRLTPDASKHGEQYGCVYAFWRGVREGAYVRAGQVSEGVTEAPRTQSELLARIESVQPWSPEVALQICRVMLEGWRQDTTFFAPPDWASLSAPERAHSSVYVNCCVDRHGHTRLRLIEACETARARYAERQQGKQDSRADSQGHGTLRESPSAVGSGLVAGSRAGERGSDEQDRGRRTAERSSTATPPARPAPVIPEAALELTPCAECRTPLRPGQIKATRKGGMCTYCASRVDGSEWGANKAAGHYESLDSRIAAAQPPDAELGNAWQNPTWEEL